MPESTYPFPSPPSSTLSIRLLGPFDLQRDGERLFPAHSRKEEWLLAILALRPGRAVEREWLTEQLWPGRPDDKAPCDPGYNLRRCLSDIRRALGPEARRLNTPTAHTVALDLTGADVDIFEFDGACRQGDAPSLERAVSLYRGPLLEGCNEEWVLPERARREQAYLTALEQLASDAIRRQDDRTAVSYLRRAIAVDPARESIHGVLMQTLARAGDLAAVTQAYRNLRLYLHGELNAEPTPETRALYEEIRRRMQGPRPAPPLPEASLEPGGAVPLDSPLYIERPADGAFSAAVARRDSIVLVKGPRQVGKTSLLSRCLQRARAAGSRVVITDLQKMNQADLENADSFCLALIRDLADGLDLDLAPERLWSGDRAPNQNLERFLHRHVLGPEPEERGALVWGLDEVDRLFPCAFGNDLFALFRSWHNRRALDPGGAWDRLTLAITYATEAHLFVTDLNQSPFNVGTRLTLGDFTADEVTELNRRCGEPLRNDGELARFLGLVGGHPYLVRRGLHELADRRTSITELEALAACEDSPFGDHLRRLLFHLSREGALAEAVRAVLAGEGCPSLGAFHRLRSAGVLAGNAPEKSCFRCPLYRLFLEKHLR